ncbi:MAG TPA: MotA/TolQ/ExbB proton channel family protein [Longimicrobiales bacterium]
MDLSLTEMWNQMGWFVRGIVFTMIAMSIITIAVAVSKWRTLARMSRETRAFAPKFSQALESENINEALALTEKHKGSHVALVLGEALREVAPLLGNRDLAGPVITSTERAIEREQILLAADLKKGLGVLATIGATAPFVGLLGTVIGIVNSFTGIAATGGGGLEAVSAGIAEALIATAIGLLAAIPAVWLYNYFTGRLERLFSELAYAGRELVDWMLLREARAMGALTPAAPRTSGTTSGTGSTGTSSTTR